MPTLQASEIELVVSDGDAAYNTSAEVAALIEANTGSGTFAKIWEKTVPAQQFIRWGFGSPNTQNNQGYAYFFALDAGTGFEEGLVRLVVANANESRSRLVKQMASQRLHTTTSTNAITATPTNIQEMVPLPAQKGLAGPDSLLQIWFKTTSATTTVDVTQFLLPCTLYI